MGNPQTIGFNPYMFSNSQMPYGMPNYGNSGDFYNMLFNGYMAQMQGQTNKSSSAGTNTVSEETKQAQLQARKQEQELLRAKGCYDGKDDGKIGFWGAVKNIGKGCVKLFTNMFMKDGKFSLGRTLKTLAVTAAAVGLTVATGGAAAPFLIAAGVAAGGSQLIGGIVKAASATTDAQAAAGWQDIGSGSLGVGLSIAGAKGALKMTGKSGPSNPFKATGECFKLSWQSLQAAWKNKGALLKRETYTNFWATAKTNVKKAYSNETTIANANKKFDKLLNKYTKKEEAINKVLQDEKITLKKRQKATKQLEALTLKKDTIIEIKRNYTENIRQMAQKQEKIAKQENAINNLKLNPEPKVAKVQQDALAKIKSAKTRDEMGNIIRNTKKELGIKSDSDPRIQPLLEAWACKNKALKTAETFTKTERIIFNTAKYYDGSKSPSNYAIPSLATHPNQISEAQKTAYAQSALAKSKEAETAANNATNPFTLGYDPVNSYFGQYQQALAQNGYMT